MSAIAPVLENVATSEPKPLKMSFEEWLAWDYEGGLTEWIDGEVHIYMPATKIHQRLVDFLSAILTQFVALYQLGFVATGPYSMRAIPGENGREPDLFFVAKENLAQIRETVVEGPADLVVEIISTDSVARDRDSKFIEYEKGGVREYWILDPRPNRRRADFYVLDESGYFQPVPIPSDRIYHSAVVPNFWIKVDWLWDEKMNPLTAFIEIVGTQKMSELVNAQK